MMDERPLSSSLIFLLSKSYDNQSSQDISFLRLTFYFQILANRHFPVLAPNLRPIQQKQKSTINANGGQSVKNVLRLTQPPGTTAKPSSFRRQRFLSKEFGHPPFENYIAAFILISQKKLICVKLMRYLYKYLLKPMTKMVILIR